MHESVDAAEVHERAEVDDRGDGTGKDHALDELVQDVLALLLAVLFEHHAAGEHDVVAVAVHLDDARLEALAEEHVEVLHAAKVHERCRQEAAQADVEDETALDDLDDLALDVLAGFELLLDVVPRALVRGALLGEDEAAVLVFLLEDEGLDLVAELHDVGRVGVLADRELARRDDAFGLVADVEQDLVPLDLDHGTGHQVTVVEIGDGAVDEGVHLLVGVLVIVVLDVAVVLVYHCGGPFRASGAPGANVSVALPSGRSCSRGPTGRRAARGRAKPVHDTTARRRRRYWTASDPKAPPLLRLGPVRSRTHAHLERHVQLRDSGHRLAHHRRESLEFGRRRLEDEFVVHLEHHARLETPRRAVGGRPRSSRAS